MSRVAEESESMAELRVRVGQREHRLIDLGIRDPEQPTSDPAWWAVHRETRPECCGTASQD